MKKLREKIMNTLRQARDGHSQHKKNMISLNT